MVTVNPFHAIRPRPELAKDIATLPYDVLNSQEAYDLAKDNPYSYLHIDKAEIDLPKTLSPYDPKVYQQAALALKTFLEKGWLVKEDAPLFYLYELTMAGRSQTGLVACTSIHDYLSGHINKHELTRHEKELDRINHVDACDANTSPIFLTYRNQPDISSLIDRWKTDHAPIYDFDSFHGVGHRVWLIDDQDTIRAISSYFHDDVPALYIADGHHRTESAVKVGQKRLAQAAEPAESRANYFLSVLFPADELAIYDYNRVLNVPIPENLLEQLSVSFDIVEISAAHNKPEKKHAFTMYLEKKWYELNLKQDKIPVGLVDSLDAAILQEQVFSTIFHIHDSRSDNRIDFVGGIRGIQELEKLVDSGDFNIAFALYPTSMTDLLAVADAGEIMPPKSTWFEPKLLSGLFLHDLETNSR